VAADKVDARQLEATIAKPPSYLTMDDELWSQVSATFSPWVMGHTA
jgi:hypothetical protein